MLLRRLRYRRPQHSRICDASSWMESWLFPLLPAIFQDRWERLQACLYADGISFLLLFWANAEALSEAQQICESAALYGGIHQLRATHPSMRPAAPIGDRKGLLSPGGHRSEPSGGVRRARDCRRARFGALANWGARHATRTDCHRQRRPIQDRRERSASRRRAIFGGASAASCVAGSQRRAA